MRNRDAFLTLAAEACDYARAIIQECATEINIPKETIWDRYHKIYKVRFNFFSHQQSAYRLVGIPDDTSYLWMKRSLINAREQHTGNCLEYARIVMNFLRKKITTGTAIEIVCIIGGDHAFCVIGRSTDLIKFAHGEDERAVICDPYSTRSENRVYPAVEIRQRMHCFRDYTEENEPWPYKNEEFEFDPDLHAMNVFYSQVADIDIECSETEIHTAKRRITLMNNQLRKVLSAGSPIYNEYLSEMAGIVQDISTFQANFASAETKDHYIAVQRYLNSKIRSAMQLLCKLFAQNNYHHILSDELILDTLMASNGKPLPVHELSVVVFKMIVHLDDETLMQIFSVMKKNRLFDWITYTRFVDSNYKEKNLTLLTLVLRRRNSEVFTHLLYCLSEATVYNHLIKWAEPFDRFFRWIELYPDTMDVMATVLRRLQDILNPFEVRNICAISNDYKDRVMENEVLAGKLRFVELNSVSKKNVMSLI